MCLGSHRQGDAHDKKSARIFTRRVWDPTDTAATQVKTTSVSRGVTGAAGMTSSLYPRINKKQKTTAKQAGYGTSGSSHLLLCLSEGGHWGGDWGRNCAYRKILQRNTLQACGRQSSDQPRSRSPAGSLLLLPLQPAGDSWSHLTALQTTK